MRLKAELAQECAEKTVAYESVVAELKGSRENALGAQLGALLKRKGAKVSEIVARWGGPDGSIDRTEFREEVVALGLKADDAEIHELFTALDEDGGGTLDLSEVSWR